MVGERGLSATLDRGVRFVVRRLVALLIRLPGVRHARAAYQRLHRSIERRGVGGTVNLGAPVVRHHVVHSLNRGRARVNGTIAAIRAKVRPEPTLSGRCTRRG